MINIDPNIVSDGLNLLPTQYTSSTNLKNVITGNLERVQLLENARVTLQNRTLENSVGTQLDNFGNDLNQPRNGMSDTDYRIRIKAKIAENNSEGTREEIIQVARLLLQDADIAINAGQASYTLTFAHATQFTGVWADIVAALTNSTCSGVEVNVQESTSTPFGFVTTTGSPNINRLGFDQGELASGKP